MAAVDCRSAGTREFAVLDQPHPETLSRTNFSLLQVENEVNIEVETQTQVIVETVERTVERMLGERFAECSNARNCYKIRLFFATTPKIDPT